MTVEARSTLLDWSLHNAPTISQQTRMLTDGKRERECVREREKGKKKERNRKKEIESNRQKDREREREKQRERE